jgi:hypothetical protein
MPAFASAAFTAKLIPKTASKVTAVKTHSPGCWRANSPGPTNIMQMSSVRKLN